MSGIGVSKKTNRHRHSGNKETVRKEGDGNKGRTLTVQNAAGAGKAVLK
jgi:hypothetical protein